VERETGEKEHRGLTTGDENRRTYKEGEKAGGEKHGRGVWKGKREGEKEHKRFDYRRRTP
jgi:hypothetical protein